MALIGDEPPAVLKQDSVLVPNQASFVFSVNRALSVSVQR